MQLECSKHIKLLFRVKQCTIYVKSLLNLFLSFLTPAMLQNDFPFHTTNAKLHYSIDFPLIAILNTKRRKIPLPTNKDLKRINTSV